MHTDMLTAKRQILSRRVTALRTELDAWLERAADRVLEKNYSQIRALYCFMHTLCILNEVSLAALDPAGDVNRFLDGASDLTGDLVKSHFIWGFFRDRLELRFVPQFREQLLTADLISHDCYSVIIDKARALRIIPKHGFREYPLIGLMAQWSPATWPRGWRPWGLQNPNLPIPIIDLPWDHLANSWELLVIAHEVGHDVDEDLGELTKALWSTITNCLEEAQMADERVSQWVLWTSEILADLVGILLAGPAFVQVLAGLLTLPGHCVRHIDPEDPHPPHYLRVFINTALLRRLGLEQSADVLESEWKALYGEPGDRFNRYFADIELVVAAILDTPIVALRDLDGKLHSLSELIVFTPDDQARIQEASVKLAAAARPDRLPLRHICSASQLAFAWMVQTGDTGGLTVLADHVQRTIVDMAPRRKLPARLVSPHAQQHLEKLARAYLEHPLDDIGVQSIGFRGGDD